ncbi:type 1 fimbrial protein [Cronobacter malonaticus]|jgi:type 1 fimbria pilin|nr:type 1 fimbrial protein [Cronobacter malonaticus]
MQRSFISLLLMTCMPFMAVAATHGHGRVQMQGTIIDTACAIATGEADQSISMGTLPVSELMKNGRGPSVPLTVHLVNCVLNGTDIRGVNHWKDVRITFAGKADGPRRFALQGEARGEALVIADSHGVEAEPGKPMPPLPIEPGNMALHYRLWLTGDNKKIRPGHLNTTIRYFMEYD